MPKVELHIHLEGSIQPKTLLILAQQNNIKLPTLNNINDFFKFKDFNHFIEVYTLLTNCLKTPADYELIAYQFGHEQSKQNIRYSEVTFSLATNCRMAGLSWQSILDALSKGRIKARDEFGVDWGWILDILRDDYDTQTLVLDAALKYKNDGVVGIGLSGNEDAAPTEKFAASIKTARENGLNFVPHSGETQNPEFIWDVIEQLHPERIGHGISCMEDPKLVAYLKQAQLPLEICPTSNICVGVFSNIERHPIRKFRFVHNG